MPATFLEARGARATVSGPRAIARREGDGFSAPGNRAAQGRLPFGSRKRLAQGWRAYLQPSWKRAAQRRRPSGPGQSCGARAKAFRPQEIARRKGGGLPSPEKRLAQGWRTCPQPSWKRAARGRRPFGPRQSCGARAVAFRLPEAPRARLAGMPATFLEARGARGYFRRGRAFRREMPLSWGRRLAEEAAGRAQKTRPAAEWGWAGSGSERGISGRALWKHPGAAAGPRAASGQGPGLHPGGCGRRGCRCRPP